jgi:hypothetical protein
MSEVNFIITKPEDLRNLLYGWMNERIKSHSKPLTRAELADFLDVSTVTITEWMKKGLPHHRLYGRVYFLKEEVMAAMPTVIRNNPSSNQNNPI